MAFIGYALALTFALINLDGTQGQVPLTAPPHLVKYEQSIRQCYNKNKPNLDDCYLKFWNDIIPLLAKGVPEYNIPSIEPLVLDQIVFAEQSPLFKVSAKFTKIKAVGASKMVPKKVTVDRKTRKATLDLYFPFINVTGNYEVNGSVALFPVDGSGTFILNMAEINGTGTFDLIQRGTLTSMSKPIIDFGIGNIHINVVGILGGDAVGDAINKLINENSRVLFDDVKPAIIKQFQDELYKYVKDQYVELPPDAFA